MKMPRKLILSLSLLIPFISNAQSDQDALRYSQTSIAGTARFVGMGGAFGALGGDFTSLTWNPAGIGLYRKSEFTFSPSFVKEKTTSDYLGSSRSDSKYNFNFGNIGYVFTYPLTRNDSSPGWKSWSFGIGYNRINNFHTQVFAEGMNSRYSLLDHYTEQANGKSS